MNATLSSIFQQFDYWRAASFPAPVPGSDDTWVIVGCGTSYNIALSVAAAFVRNGHTAIAVPAGEWLVNRDSYVANGTGVRVLALSRSGESTETVRAVEASGMLGDATIGVTCSRDTALERAAGICHVIETHPEEGIVMTASASLMLLAGFAMAGLAIGDGLANRAEGTLRALEGLDTSTLHRRDHIVFLGGGVAYGLALEGALKVMEMAICATQGFHPGEYRHGPISLVDNTVAIVMLYSPETAEAEALLAAELREKGAFVLGVGGPGDLSVPVRSGDIELGAEILPVLQLLGERHAVARGRDTASPRHLSKVVLLA